MISKKILKEDIEKLFSHYAKFETEKPNNEYILKCYKTNDTKIIVYTNNKNPYFKVTFDGKNERKEADKFNGEEKLKKEVNLNPESKNYVTFKDQIGSDEVGVGDFFFPLIVVSVYLDHKNKDLIEQFGIKDSKKMGDAKILEVVPQILKYVELSKLTLPNSKLSTMANAKEENMVSVKIKMHNSANYNMQQKHPHVPVYVDEFVNGRKYYSYLEGEEKVVKNIVFKTKGETYYPSVALASVIARYALLKYKEQMDEKYHVSFPFGAGKNVDDFAIKFAREFGVTELKKLVKTNFSNLTRIIDALNS